MSKLAYYALYKGDDILFVGTIKEIAKYLGVKERSVYFYKTPTYQKRNKGNNAYLLVKLEDEDERN